MLYIFITFLCTSMQALALPFPNIPLLPTIQNEIFSMTQKLLNPPRINLNFISGVPTILFSIGTPPQEFIGVFDTATPITWIMSDQCNSTVCQGVPNFQKFHSNNSSSNLQLPLLIDLSYYDGSHVKLKPELDTVTFANKFKFFRHLVAEAYEIDYPKGFQTMIRARLGLGNFGSIDWTKTKLTVDKIKPPNFLSSFIPGKRAAGDNRYSTGYVTSGSTNFRKRDTPNFAWILGVDTSLFTGKVYDIPLVQSSGLDSPFWKIRVLGFQIKVKNATGEISSKVIPTSTGAHGKIYSSSPNLVVPENIAATINLMLNGKYDKRTGFYEIPCTLFHSGPNLTFLLSNGVHAEILSSQYIRQESNICYSLITGGGDGTNILLGGPFFTSFYLIYQFSNKAIGVASSISGFGKVYTA